MFNPTEREKRVLDKIKAIKKPTKKIVVKQPKKVLSKQEQEILEIIESKEKATVRLEKVLKLVK